MKAEIGREPLFVSLHRFVEAHRGDAVHRRKF
jgi:hypothetical protein